MFENRGGERKKRTLIRNFNFVFVCLKTLNIVISNEVASSYLCFIFSLIVFFICLNDFFINSDVFFYCFSFMNSELYWKCLSIKFNKLGLLLNIVITITLGEKKNVFYLDLHLHQTFITLTKIIFCLLP